MQSEGEGAGVGPDPVAVALEDGIALAEEWVHPVVELEHLARVVLPQFTNKWTPAILELLVARTCC